ncbi:MAG: polyphosphate polymerase domain-containing protein [Myxococcales bacterium]|nr:polyphosphate polymerase domain-containing protein [Myxococcales bacterium]
MLCDGQVTTDVQRKYRFEIKYRLDVDRAAALRRWVQGTDHLAPDAFGEGGSAAYNVHSLYLDSADWVVYRETRAGLQQRYKVRARCYNWTSPRKVFLEVKHRANESMWKTRAEVGLADAVRVVNGEPPSASTPSTEALENFRGLVDRRHLYPRCWVSYRRHAYVGGVRDLVRVTFDSRIVAAPATVDLCEPPRWYPVPESAGIEILELKYSGSYPSWVAEMVRRFDLERKAFSKFRYGIDLITDPEGAVVRELGADGPGIDQ